MAKILIIQASPRARGNSARIAHLIEQRIREKFASNALELTFFEVSASFVRGCIGCDYCESSEVCVYDDEMNALIDALTTVDAVYVICPVYFSGAPSQFKAVLDRLQPLFWRREQLKKSGQPLPQKRPAYLYVVGSGGDPHGFQSLVTEVTSSFALANLKVELMQSFIGDKIVKRLVPADIKIGS